MHGQINTELASTAYFNAGPLGFFAICQGLIDSEIFSFNNGQKFLKSEQNVIKGDHFKGTGWVVNRHLGKCPDYVCISINQIAKVFPISLEFPKIVDLFENSTFLKSGFTFYIPIKALPPGEYNVEIWGIHLKELKCFLYSGEYSIKTLK